MTPTATKPKPVQAVPDGLEIVTPHPDPNVNTLLYGPPKSGKTVGASTLPGPVLYLNADRPNATRFAHSMPRKQPLTEGKIDGLESLVHAAELIQAGAYRSVVLDPIGEVYRVVLEGLSGKATRPKLNEYGDTGVHVERFCRMLCEAPVNACLVCHEVAVRDEDSGSFERLPFTGTNNPALAAKLMAMVDVIGYTGAVEAEDGSTHYMAQLVTGRGRRGGDRFGVLGRSRDLNLSEWIDLAKRSETPNTAPVEPAQKEK